jgi:hypothetical protein
MTKAKICEAAANTNYIYFKYIVYHNKGCTIAQVSLKYCSDGTQEIQMTDLRECLFVPV